MGPLGIAILGIIVGAMLWAWEVSYESEKRRNKEQEEQEKQEAYERGLQEGKKYGKH